MPCHLSCILIVLGRDRGRCLVYLLRSGQYYKSAPRVVCFMNPPLTALTEVQFSLDLPQVSPSHQQVAEKMAREAYVMALLSQGSISVGRAARLLAIERSQLSNLMTRYGISPFPDQSIEELQSEVAVALAHLGE
jgi:predicted HTH domain antitoxin